jgi:hypothetical protein
MGAYAEALGRDRWRIYKCEERLRVVNLGGTAIGTGIAAPRAYIFRVVEEFRTITGIGFARAENLEEATQNADVFVEVMGMLKALASPFGDVTFCPTGGVTFENAPEFLALPNVACVGGSWVAPKEVIARGDWTEITALARAAAALRRGR